MRHIILAFVVPFSLMVACGGDAPPTPSDGTPLDAGAVDGLPTMQTPPRGRAALDAWLDAGHYKSWRCEQQIMDARPKGAHGRNRVCSNDLLSASPAAPFPIGSASVKEIVDAQDALVGLAVGLKISTGTGPSTWYWYERLRGSTAADGTAVPVCAGCHGQAQEDHVFVRVR